MLGTILELHEHKNLSGKKEKYLSLVLIIQGGIRWGLNLEPLSL
jgi:hypothetical protein